MKDLSPEIVSIIGLLALGAVVSSLMMIGWIARRRHRRLPVLPYEPRRPVPWGVVDVVAVAFIYLGSIICVQLLDIEIFGPMTKKSFSPRDRLPQIRTPLIPIKAVGETKDGDKDAEVEHPLVTLIRENPSPGTFLLALLTGVVIAPIVEEFLFRLVLQGWLEAIERRLRRIGRRGRRTVIFPPNVETDSPPRFEPGPPTAEVNPYASPLARTCAPTRGRGRWSIGAGPVLVTSLFFAALHFREAMPARDPDALTRALADSVLAGLLTLVLASTYLRLRSGATLADFGVVPRRVWGDVRLGLLAFLTIAAPVYLLQVVWRKLLPENIAPDPFTLAFFAIILGVLYFRTHRLVASITLHMALNATSLALAWLVYAH